MATVEQRLQKIEEQNARILSLLEEIAGYSIHSRGKKLPAEKPDFEAIEAALRAVLAGPTVAAILEFDGFEAKQWLCSVKILHKVKDIGEHWDIVESVVKSVANQCKIPGRVAGGYRDPNDRQREIGEILEFGYSREVGYDYQNEFHP
jgi:hypothetical protein